MKAIVYTSNTGYTARYAAMLARETGLPAYDLQAACRELPKGTPVIYLGWLMASMVMGYRKAAKRFIIKTVCGVGMCHTGTLLSEVRKANRLPEKLPLFTLQGGMDHSRLTGIYKKMIQTLIWFMEKAKDPSADDQLKLQLIRDGGDFVNIDNLSAVLDWWKEADT